VLTKVKFTSGNGHHITFGVECGNIEEYWKRVSYLDHKNYLKLDFIWNYVISSFDFELSEMLKGSDRIHSTGDPSCPHSINIQVNDGEAFKDFRYESIDYRDRAIVLKGSYEITETTK